jgi:hypothetical protein
MRDDPRATLENDLITNDPCSIRGVGVSAFGNATLHGSQPIDKLRRVVADGGPPETDG